MNSNIRIFMIGLFVLVFSSILYVILGLSEVKPANGSSPSNIPIPANSQSSVDMPVDLNTITCPVCNKIVNPANASRKERFYDRILYFDSEECYVKFLNDPITYSKNLKVRVNIDMKPVPSQLQPETNQEPINTPESLTPQNTTMPESSMTPKEDILQEIPLDGTVPGDRETPMAEELPSPTGR